MKVRITPIITRDEINIPISNFQVLEDTTARDVALSDLNHPMHNILSDISGSSITPTTIKERTFFESISDPIFTECYQYKENSVTRFDVTKFRDCSDVAVKLAFLLNQDQTSYHTIDELMNSDAVSLITNNLRIDKMDLQPENLVRLKQSSDIEKIKYCNERMTSVAQKIIDENTKFVQQMKELTDAHLLALQDITIERNELIDELQNTYNANLSGNHEEYNELL